MRQRERQLHRIAHTHRLAPPLTGRGAQPLSAPRVSTGHSPPRAERGSDTGSDPIYCAAIKQLTIAGGPHAGRRSLKLPRRPRLPATSHQGARRGAHRRPPHTSPTTTDSTVIPWRKNAPSQRTYYAHPVRLISTPGLGPAGRWDSAAVIRETTAPSWHTESCHDPAVVVGSGGKRPSAQLLRTPFGGAHALWALVFLA